MTKEQVIVAIVVAVLGVIGTYESQTEAARQVGLNNKNISASLKKGKPCNGYVFSFA